MSDFTYCKQIIRRHGKTYYFATYFFPKDIRLAIYALYAFVRSLDTIVDHISHPIEAQEEFSAWLRQWREAEHGKAPSRPEMRAFLKVVARFGIDRAYIDAFIASMEMDLSKKSYRTVDELEEYMYGSSTVIGFMLLQIVGDHRRDILPYAKDLAEAMQLANILKNIKRDCQKRGRIYVTRDVLTRYELTMDDVKNQRICRPFMKFKIKQARTLFQSSRPGIDMLSPRVRFPVLLALALHEHLLDAIEQRNYDVFHQKIRIGFFKKLFLAARTYLRYRKYHKGKPVKRKAA